MEVTTTYNFKATVDGMAFDFNVPAKSEAEARTKLATVLENIVTQLLLQANEKTPKTA